jgi:anthranilate phosphoribosyltransferase
MTAHDAFRQLVKKKGTGNTMSKHLLPDEISFALNHLNNPSIPLAMKATLLTAWQMLDATPDEAHALRTIQNDPTTHIPNDLLYLVNHEHCAWFEQHIAPAMKGKGLTTKAFTQCLTDIYNKGVPEHKAAALFEALRLKEETREENCAAYDFFKLKAANEPIDCPVVIDIASAYDGFNRHYCLLPFLAALLASVGLPCVLHGAHETSPKNGMNTHKLLVQAGKNPVKPLTDVANGLMAPNIGWGYVDQSVFCPALHDLMPMRLAMVKRPVLSTIEKWLRPISGKRTACITGFTHPPYKQKTLDIIQHAKVFDDLILVRGVEGSSLLPMDRRTPFIVSRDHHAPSVGFVAPDHLGMVTHQLDNQDPNNSLSAGIDALSGKNQPLANFLCYQCLAIGHGIGMDLTSMNLALHHAISNGKALAHWKHY